MLSESHGLTATAYGQGAHGLAVGDVDGDGCDEITYGSAAIDNNGALLYSTGLGHGDAFHLSDLDPDRPGLEYYMVLETKPYGSNKIPVAVYLPTLIPHTADLRCGAQLRRRCLT